MLSDTPTYPVVGNHEAIIALFGQSFSRSIISKTLPIFQAYPVNMFPPFDLKGEHSPSKLYGGVS